MSQSPPRLLLHCAQSHNNPHRIAGPNKFLETIPGVRLVNDPSGFDPSLADPEEARIFLMHRAFPRKSRDLDFIRRAVDAGYLLVLDLDDATSAFPDFHDDDDFAARALHAVQAASEPIAAEFRGITGEVAVFANQLPDLPAAPRLGAEAPVRVFFGAFNRGRDWGEIIEPLNRVLGETGAEMRVVHDRGFFDALTTGRKHFTPRGSYEGYLAALSECDIALMPLRDTAFNRAKSDLKFLESAASGTAVLAPVVVYGATIRDGETGLVYRDLVEFEAGLRRLVDDPALRHALGGNAFEYVKRERMLADHYLDRYHWYLDLVARADELRAAQRARLPELIP